MACAWSRFTAVTMGPLAMAAAQLLPCPASAQKAISGDGIAQIDLRQPASFSTYTVTGDPVFTDVTFIGSAFVADTDAVTEGGSARSYVFRNRGTIRTSGTKSAGVLLGCGSAAAAATWSTMPAAR